MFAMQRFMKHHRHADHLSQSSGLYPPHGLSNTRPKDQGRRCLRAAHRELTRRMFEMFAWCPVGEAASSKNHPGCCHPLSACLSSLHPVWLRARHCPLRGEGGLQRHGVHQERVQTTEVSCLDAPQVCPFAAEANRAIPSSEEMVAGRRFAVGVKVLSLATADCLPLGVTRTEVGTMEEDAFRSVDGDEWLRVAGRTFQAVA